MRKVEFCTGSTGVTNCDDAVTIGSGDTVVDIASVDAGAAAAADPLGAFCGGIGGTAHHEASIGPAAAAPLDEITVPRGGGGGRGGGALPQREWPRPWAWGRRGG